LSDDSVASIAATDSTVGATSTDSTQTAVAASTEAPSSAAVGISAPVGSPLVSSADVSTGATGEVIRQTADALGHAVGAVVAAARRSLAAVAASAVNAATSVIFRSAGADDGLTALLRGVVASAGAYGADRSAPPAGAVGPAKGGGGSSPGPAPGPGQGGMSSAPSGAGGVGSGGHLALLVQFAFAWPAIRRPVVLSPTGSGPVGFLRLLERPG
jgi:hypothetical protein